MVAIYVHKSWLKTIGDIADLVIVREDTGEYVSLLSGLAEVNFSFVESQLARKEITEEGDVFLPAKIPSAVISGIFDLTTGQVNKLGFHPPTKQ